MNSKGRTTTVTKLKPKSIAVLNEILRNPKISHTEAYMRHHDTKNRNTARTTVQELMTKPAATIYLQQHVDKARGKIVELLDKGKDEIQLRAAQDILDREYGKAKQTTEVTSTGISLNIDLTSALTEAD